MNTKITIEVPDQFINYCGKKEVDPSFVLYLFMQELSEVSRADHVERHIDQWFTSICWPGEYELQYEAEGERRLSGNYDNYGCWPDDYEEEDDLR